jgi:arylsulfatase A-like enzyme
MMKKTNIILLTIDTLRADALKCYGAQANLTPNLDRLAASGVRFEQAITGGSWTQAAFPVLLTSSYAAMFGGCLGRLAAERPSPIEALAEQGYATGGFSTNPHLSRATGYDRGFRHFSDLLPAETDPRLRRIKGGQRLLRSPWLHAALRPLGYQLRPARLYSPAAEVTDRVCQWLGQAETPFFAWAHYMDLHWPYHLEESLSRPREIAQAWQDLALMDGRANFNRSKPMTTDQRDRMVRLYEQSLRYLDAEVGRLLTQVDAMGLGQDTVVVVVSDHGEEFLDHGRWGHWESNLYDEILKVPFIARGPGWEPGRVVQPQVRLLDLMPTLLDLCGCALPSDLMGVSLVPLMSQPQAEYDGQSSISEMRRDAWHRVAVRTEAFKYIWDNKRPLQPELYDLRADPRETRNVSDRYPQQVDQFQASVDAHLRRVAATEPGMAVEALEVDQDVTRRLRDLGYIE